MTLKHVLKKVIFLFKNIRKIKLKNLFKTLIAAASDFPVIETVEFRGSKFSGVVGDFLFESLKLGVDHEPHFKEIAKLCIAKNSNIIDLGANIGTHTVFCSKIATEGLVYSFEPQSLVYSLLQSNVIANKCKNVVSYKFAVSDVTNKLMAMDYIVYSSDNLNIGGVRVDGNSPLGDKSIFYKLDDLISSKVDFIKMDVQGSELLALKGAEVLLMNSRPIIFAEIEELHLRALNTSSVELIEYILGLNYTLFKIKSEYPCDHLCVPNERVDWFIKSILPSYRFETERISGRKVNLKFANSSSNVYKAIEVIN